MPDIGRVVVVVGVPGVGKSTVLSEVLKILNKRRITAELAVFGTVMLEQAKRGGVKDRDELRRLPVRRQRELQVKAARTISKGNKGIKIVDTHLFINTNEGYWPGLPADVLEALAPTNFVLVEAAPSEVLSRRSGDLTRRRDEATKETILREIELGRYILGAASIVTGAPMLVVENSEGSSKKAAELIVKAIGRKR